MLRLLATRTPSAVLRAAPRCSLASPLATAPMPALRCAATPSLRRLCSTEAKPAEAAEEKEVLVYEGAKNKIVMTLKKLSIANLGFAVMSAPVLQYITSAAGAGGKGVAMSGLVRHTQCFFFVRRAP